MLRSEVEFTAGIVIFRLGVEVDESAGAGCGGTGAGALMIIDSSSSPSSSFSDFRAALECITIGASSLLDFGEKPLRALLS